MIIYHRYRDTTDKPHHTAYCATVNPSNHLGKQMHAQAIVSEYKYACGSDKWAISKSRHRNKHRFYMKYNKDHIRVYPGSCTIRGDGELVGLRKGKI